MVRLYLHSDSGGKAASVPENQREGDEPESVPEGQQENSPGEIRDSGCTPGYAFTSGTSPVGATESPVLAAERRFFRPEVSGSRKYFHKYANMLLCG